MPGHTFKENMHETSLRKNLHFVFTYALRGHGRFLNKSEGNAKHGGALA
jgi:hypothetical protein